MSGKTSLHLVIIGTIALSVVSSQIVKGHGNNDNQPGQSRHDGKRAMDNMYKGMMESFKTSFVPGSKKDDGGNGDASPSDWKNMIPGFAKGFIPDSAEGDADNSTISEDAATDTAAANSTSVGVEGSFKVNAGIKDDKSIMDESMTSKDGGSPDSTALPEVLPTDDNVPSEYGLLNSENDLAGTNTQSSETTAMESTSDVSQNEQANDMAQLENDLATTQGEDSSPPGDMGSHAETTETGQMEQEPSSDTKKSMFLKVAMSGNASLKKDEKTVTETAAEEKKEMDV
ncbi:uncharacterized protein LOC117333643 [Pecten maximus]|uniref:uncharacterized protein LOC117333643 n=1 Tax=Pecten maximus TaxID=6579 RepID=UPI0014588611|nr:uncharacterized protein LOC117333643 [Pecten maximus]